MEQQTFTIPEGFELKQTGENQFSIVPKQNIQEKNDSHNIHINNGYNPYMQGDVQEIERQQMARVANRYENSFFKPKETREDYDFDDEEVIRGKSREDLFEERYFGNSYNTLQDMYHSGKIKQLNRHEMELLKFCHGIDVKKFIKEEFERNPIVLDRDENGNVYVKNPHKPIKIDDDREL